MTTRLRLFGRAKVAVDDAWMEAPYDKRFALLAYLACAPGGVERERLAFLFWPDLEESRARRDLRHLIRRTKTLSFAAGLEAGLETLSWRVDTDVARLARSSAERDWAAVVSLYEGPMLEGLDIASPEYMSWLDLERHNRHDMWREAVLARAAELGDGARFAEAADVVKLLVAADELDEEALRLFLRHSHLAGRREEALSAYARFVRELDHGLGLEPLTATQEVAAALRGERPLPREPAAGEPVRPHAPSRQTARLRNFPPEATPFVGRDRELRELADLLLQPSCRLLTLSGPGGIGKTRLAQEAAGPLAARWADGAAFVPLAGIDERDALAPAILAALSLSFFDEREPEAQVIGHLRDKELLLVLDNLEHLSNPGDLVVRLLDEAPGLTILGTSRDKLHLAREWTYPVMGLSVSASGDPLAPEGGDAPQLFLRCARRVRSDLQIGEEERGAISRICAVVGGAPLGIELAAGWLALLTCAEIADTLSREGLDFLATSLHDVPARHRSLREVFEHSWRLLSEEQRTALAALSVFQGGFTRTSAAAVAGTRSRTLLSLVEKSLMSRQHGGRLGLHELVRQYAAEKLGHDVAAEAELRASHSAYFATFLGQREPTLRSGQAQGAALEEVEKEFENVRRAWDRAVERGDAALLERMASGLRFYAQTRGLFRFAADAFERGAQAVGSGNAVYGRLLLYRGLFAFWLGRHEQARTVVEESLTALEQRGGPRDVIVNATFLLGLVQRRLGDTEAAKARFDEALILARQAGERYFEARSLQGLGWIAESEGALDEAQSYYEQCITVHELSEDRYGSSLAYFNLGELHERNGRPQRAEERYRKGMEAGRSVGSSLRVAEGLILLGRSLQARGEYGQAEAHYRECRASVAGRDDEPFSVVMKHCLLGLGQVAAAGGRFKEALGHLHGALSIALAFDDLATAVRSLVAVAEALAESGADAEALSVLTFVRQQGDLSRGEHRGPPGSLHGGVLAGELPPAPDAADPGTRANRSASADGPGTLLATRLSARPPAAATASASWHGKTLRFSDMPALLSHWIDRLPG